MAVSKPEETTPQSRVGMVDFRFLAFLVAHSEQPHEVRSGFEIWKRACRDSGDRWTSYHNVRTALKRLASDKHRFVRSSAMTRVEKAGEVSFSAHSITEEGCQHFKNEVHHHLVCATALITQVHHAWQEGGL